MSQMSVSFSHLETRSIDSLALKLRVILQSWGDTQVQRSVEASNNWNKTYNKLIQILSSLLETLPYGRQQVSLELGNGEVLSLNVESSLDTLLTDGQRSFQLTIQQQSLDSTPLNSSPRKTSEGLEGKSIYEDAVSRHLNIVSKSDLDTPQYFHSCPFCRREWKLDLRGSQSISKPKEGK